MLFVISYCVPKSLQAAVFTPSFLETPAYFSIKRRTSQGVKETLRKSKNPGLKRRWLNRPFFPSLVSLQTGGIYSYTVSVCSFGIPVPVSTRILGGLTAGKAGVFFEQKIMLKITWICATPVCNFLAKHTSF